VNNTNGFFKGFASGRQHDCVNPASSDARDDTGARAATISLLCGAGVTVEVSLDTGTSLGRPRRLSQESGTDRLEYDLSQDPARQIYWGDGRDAVELLTTGAPQTVPIYGQIPAGQKVRDGTYSDTITITVFLITSVQKNPGKSRGKTGEGWCSCWKREFPVLSHAPSNLVTRQSACTGACHRTDRAAARQCGACNAADHCAADGADLGVGWARGATGQHPAQGNCHHSRRDSLDVLHLGAPRPWVCRG
jgi:hypothetical protein